MKIFQRSRDVFRSHSNILEEAFWKKGDSEYTFAQFLDQSSYNLPFRILEQFFPEGQWDEPSVFVKSCAPEKTVVKDVCNHRVLFVETGSLLTQSRSKLYCWLKIRQAMFRGLNIYTVILRNWYGKKKQLQFHLNKLYFHLTKTFTNGDFAQTYFELLNQQEFKQNEASSSFSSLVFCAIKC